MVTEITSSYLQNNKLPVDQIPALIQCIHEALSAKGLSNTMPRLQEPAVPVKRSVHNDYVVCLECGIRHKMLKRHLTVAHGLTVVDYRIKWGLAADHPIVAPAYSQRRPVPAACGPIPAMPSRRRRDRSAR